MTFTGHSFVLFTCPGKSIIHCSGNALDNFFEHFYELWGYCGRIKYYSTIIDVMVLQLSLLGETPNLIRELSTSPMVRGGVGWRCRNVSPRRIIKSDHLIFQKTKWNEQTVVFKSSEPPQTLLEESRIMLYCSVSPQFKSLVTLSSSFAHLKRPAKRSFSVYNNVVKVGQECRLSWGTLALTLRKLRITSDDVAILRHPLTILCAIVSRYWKQ